MIDALLVAAALAFGALCWQWLGPRIAPDLFNRSGVDGFLTAYAELLLFSGFVALFLNWRIGLALLGLMVVALTARDATWPDIQDARRYARWRKDIR